MHTGKTPADEPFTQRQLSRLEKALGIADSSTGLVFSVYVGDVDQPSRLHAEKLHQKLVNPMVSVLLVVCPNQRVVEIVTGGLARQRLSDRTCELAALSMTAAFAGGDLVGGVVAGLAHLVDHAGPRLPSG